MNLSFRLQILGALLTIHTIQINSQRSPLFYGWFFNETIASGLRNITSDYLAKLYGNVDRVQQFLRNESTMAGIENPLQYYTKPVDPNTGNFDPYFHITTYYCGTEDCTSYTNRVARYLNQIYATHLVGVFFTPRTYGIRVNLTSVQREIFDINETSEMTSRTWNPNEMSCENPIVNGIQFCPQDDTDIHPTDTRGTSSDDQKKCSKFTYQYTSSPCDLGMCTEYFSSDNWIGSDRNIGFGNAS